MNGITILDQAHTPMGPFSRAEVAEKLRRGEVSLGSLAFVDGLTQWTSLRDVLSHVDGVNPPAPVPVAPPAPMPGALPTPVASLATTSPIYSYAATMQPPSHLVYAGFWLRVAAILVDGVIFLPLSLISFYLQYEANSGDFESPVAKITLGLVMMGYGLFLLVARWLYFALLESSKWQATLGKKLLGLRVTGMDGQRIGFGRATGRYFAKIISALILFIGFMMAGFTERKQALHDMIASTLVVRN